MLFLLCQPKSFAQRMTGIATGYVIRFDVQNIIVTSSKSFPFPGLHYCGLNLQLCLSNVNLTT